MKNPIAAWPAFVGQEVKRLLRAEAAGGMRIATLTLIRWIGMAGQLFTVVFVNFSLGIDLPLLSLLAVIAMIPVANFWLMWRGGGERSLSSQSAMLLFIFDITQLAMMLALTGGLDNPFCMLILLPAALAATTLDRTAITIVTAWALFVTSLIAVFNLPLPWPNRQIELPALYTVATWIALALAHILIASYVWRLAKDARLQADAFAATQLALAQAQQLSALGAQAAAVAHHLGSPLGTINVVAKELVRELPADHPLAPEANDLLNESRRCREILATLGRSGDTGQHDRFTAIPLSNFIYDLTEPYQGDDVEIEIVNIVAEDTTEPVVHMPPERRHALANLIENATSFAESCVNVTLRSTSEVIVITIQDDGPGFQPEILDRIGEPYISTRQEDGGLGLGLFIANSLLARTGATLHFGNTTNGAQVRIQWPRDALTTDLEIGDGRDHDRG